MLVKITAAASKKTRSAHKQNKRDGTADSIGGQGKQLLKDDSGTSAKSDADKEAYKKAKTENNSRRPKSTKSRKTENMNYDCDISNDEIEPEDNYSSTCRTNHDGKQLPSINKFLKSTNLKNSSGDEENTKKHKKKNKQARQKMLEMQASNPELSVVQEDQTLENILQRSRVESNTKVEVQVAMPVLYSKAERAKPLENKRFQKTPIKRPWGNSRISNSGRKSEEAKRGDLTPIDTAEIELIPKNDKEMPFDSDPAEKSKSSSLNEIPSSRSEPEKKKNQYKKHRKSVSKVSSNSIVQIKRQTTSSSEDVPEISKMQYQNQIFKMVTRGIYTDKDLKDGDYISENEKQHMMSQINQMFYQPKMTPQQRDNYWQVNGILPKEFRRIQNDENRNKQRKQPLSPPTSKIQGQASELDQFDLGKFMVIQHTDTFYLIWKFLITILSLFAPYLYVTMAAFRVEEIFHGVNTLVWCIEGTFFVNMCVKFFVTYHEDGEKIPEQDLGKIAKHYLKTDFLLDLVPLFPFHIFTLPKRREDLFFLIKMVRLYQGFKILNVAVIMGIIKKKYKKNLQTLVDKDPELANNDLIDNNKIEQLILIKYMLRIIRFMIIILHTSFLVGMFWMTLLRGIEDFQHDVNYSEVYREYQEGKALGCDPELVEHHANTFIINYELFERSVLDASIILTYFAFTTLSTVGFGDYVPIGDPERLVGSMILLCGVMIFSTIMGGFVDIISEFKTLDDDINDGYKLNQFFDVFYHFNGMKPIRPEIKKQIEDHFDHKWQTDINVAFATPSDVSMFNQLPEEVQRMLFTDFMFVRFLKLFSQTFDFRKASIHKMAHYTWDDQLYRNLMFALLTKLEPIRLGPRHLIFNVLDLCQEIIFVQKGNVHIGFEINRKKMFVLQIKCGKTHHDQGKLFGDYYVTFNTRANNVYRTETTCDCYSIRKKHWHSLLHENPTFADQLAFKIKHKYDNIQKKITRIYRRKIQQLSQRADFKSLIRTTHLDLDFDPVLNKKAIVATKISKIGQNYEIVEYDLEKEIQVNLQRRITLLQSSFKKPLKKGETLEDRIENLQALPENEAKQRKNERISYLNSLNQQSTLIQSCIQNFEALKNNHQILEIEHLLAKEELKMKNALLERKARLNQKNYSQHVRQTSSTSRKYLISEKKMERISQKSSQKEIKR